MGKTKDLGHLAHIVVYDAENHITVPAGITMHTNQLVASQAWVTTALGSYALSSALGSYVPTSRTITINGTTFDLSANRSWTITAGIASVSGTSPINVSTTSGAATVSISQANTSTNGFLSSTDWNTFNGKQNALTIGNIVSNDTNLITVTGGTGAIIGSGVSLLVLPSAIVASGISSTLVTTALGYTPVTNARTITINGTAYDLSANRSWTVTATETDTLATVTARGASTSTALTLSGRVTFASAVSDRPQIPGGLLGLDTGDGNFDIWGISRDYYPSNPTTANAWGLRWNGTNNDFEFVGGGVSRVILDMDSGNVTTGLLIAQGPGGNYNENVRLPGSTAVISFNTTGLTGAGSYNIVSQTNFQIRNAGGTQVFILDQSGNLTMSGTVTAPTFSGALSGNATTASAAAGATFLTQANATWGARLQIGGNGDPGAIANVAVVQATDGNLHMDSGTGKVMYLNYYRNGTIYLNGGTYYISSNGSYYNGTAAAANAVAWGNVSSKPSHIMYYQSFTLDANTMDVNATGFTYSVNAPYTGPIVRFSAGGSYDLWLNAAYSGGGNLIAFRTRNGDAGAYNPWREFITSGNIGSQKVDGSMKLWAVTHPSDYYMVHNWTGSHWYLTVNHPSPVRVGYADYAASAGYSDAIYWSGNQRLYGGSDGTRNTGWAYHMDNGTGLHWPNNGWHLYPKDTADIYIRSGSSSESALVLNTAGTNRGYIYANNSNQIGFLNNDRSWVFKISNDGNIVMDYNYGVSITGVYASTRYQGVWSMGNAYRLPADGTSPGNLYGMSWSHPNAGGQATRLNDHGLLVMINGVTQAAISSNIWAAGSITAAGAMYMNNAYNTGWFRNYGDSGLYNQDYGCHIARNSQSSHGSWSMWGYTKAGYVGMNLQDPSGFNNNLMFEQGRGGVYQENGGGWHFYYDRPNDCIGLSGSETYDWVRACTNGKHRITNDTWCDATSWAYTFSNISDGRLKENITTVDSALDKVLQLRGVYYNWIIDTEQQKHIGLIAQETAAVCPEVVNYHDETDTYSVNYSELSGLFVESTKELNQKLMDANARIELLETKLNQLLNA